MNSSTLTVHRQRVLIPLKHMIPSGRNSALWVFPNVLRGVEWRNRLRSVITLPSAQTRTTIREFEHSETINGWRLEG